MKFQKLWLWLVLFIFLGVTSVALAAETPTEAAIQTTNKVPEDNATLSAPDGFGIDNIGSSTLANVTPAYLPIGSAFDLCFTVFVQSPDAEYMDHFDADLPDGWTVNSVAPNSVPAANGCSAALPPVAGVSAGNIVYWQSTGYPPQTGCGAWVGGSGTNFDFCANITIPDSTGAPWFLPWTLVGDGYGGEPHQTSGSYGPIEPVPPIMLTPDVIEESGCPCGMQEHELTVWNNAGYDTLVNLSYELVSGVGQCSGPRSVFVPNGASVPFTVSFLPAGQPGDTVVCEVYAEDVSQPDNNDTSALIKLLVSGGFDPAGWQLEPITAATPNQWSGSTVGSNPAAVGPVGYVVGGLAAGSSVINPDLQMYDPNTATWTQLADLPNPRFSPVAGWIEGLLYAAGGYDVAFAATNDLQVYDPATNTWDNITPANLPVSRGGGAGGVGVCSSGAGPCLFHVGGGLDSSFGNSTLETWEYDPGSNTWTQLDNKPAGSSPDGHLLGTGVGCQGFIFVGGDYRGFHEFFRLDATQPSGSQWDQVASIPAGAGAMTPALVCMEEMGALMLVGGDPDGWWGTYNNTVYVYDIATDTWNGPLPQTLHVGQLGSVGWNMYGKVWTAGGTIGAGAISPMPFESLVQVLCDPDSCYDVFNVWKDAPADASNGDVFSYNITIDTQYLMTGFFMVDPLPDGVEFANNLSWNIGEAWYDAIENAVHWEYMPVTAAEAGDYVSQVGPDVSRSTAEDGGSTLLAGPLAGITGPVTPEGYAWMVLAAPPTAVSRPAGAVDAAGNFYIIGGEPQTGQVQRYDPATGTWDNSLAIMPVPASNVCAVVLGDDIYIPGGWTGSVALTELQVYHIGSNTWEIITSDPLPGARTGPACAVYNGQLYVFGGGDGTTYYDMAWVYDPAAPAGSRWTTLAPAPYPGGYGSALAVGDHIFYAGMRDAAMTDLPYVYAYEPAADTWLTYPNLTTARGGAGMWAIGDRLLVGGGGWGSYLTSVEQYDTTQGTGGTWMPFEASLVQGRRTFAYATDPEHRRLFAGNGWAGAYLAEAEQLDFELEVSAIEIAFDVTVTGHCEDVIANEVVAGFDGIVEAFTAVTLVGGEAEINLSPIALEASLCADTTGIQTVSICNVGDCPLSWELHEMTPTLRVASKPLVPQVTLPDDAPQSLTEYLAAGKPAFSVQPVAPNLPKTVPDTLTFYNDRGAFDADYPGLPIEGYENGSMPVGTVDSIAHPLDEFSSNAYFDPGDILPGIQFWATADHSGVEIAVLGEGFISNPSKTAVANYFVDSYRVVFDPPVQAAGLDLQEFMGGYSCQVDIYGPVGYLTSVTSACDEAGVFWGVASDAVPIAELVITSLSGGAEGADNVGFIPMTYPDFLWLSQNPISGSVPWGECQDVEVTFDATGLESGDYIGELAIFSNDLNAPVTTVTAALNVPEPVFGAAFTWTPATPVTGDPVDFTATVGGGTPPFTYSWDFGDGVMGSGELASHVYTDAGTFFPELVVENACGVSTASDTLTVEQGTTYVYLSIVVKDY